MVDIELKKFYDSVKDPSWPNITNYIDFCKLPTNIKNECNTLHNFQQRKKQIEDCNYWQEITFVGYQYKDLMYIPIPKCASTYYINLFNTMGWKKKTISEIDINSVVMFGFVMHPFTRWVKGITEWIASSYYESVPEYHSDESLINTADIRAYHRATKNNNRPVNWGQFSADIQKTNIKNILDTVVIGDVHSIPLSVMFGNLINRVNCIPMDMFSSDDDIKISLMEFFKKHNHTIDIPLNTTRAWRSSEGKLKIATTVEEFYKSSTDRHYHLYKIYATDLKFYHNLVDTFDPSWQRH